MKATVTWCGVLVTFGGVVLGVITGGSLEAAGVATLGLVLTCCGHWISIAIAKHDAAERKADEDRFDDLDYRLSKSETEREHIFYAYEAQTKRTERLESDMKQKVEELRRMTYNAP
jgi:hypothetical protein